MRWRAHQIALLRFTEASRRKNELNTRGRQVICFLVCHIVTHTVLEFKTKNFRVHLINSILFCGLVLCGKCNDRIR